MGVHTGDSVTVAPAMTLTDREYQRMRDTAIAVIRAVGVDTGGCNIQFAVRPAHRPDGRDRDEPAGLARHRRWPPRPPASRSPRSRPGWPSATPSTRSANDITGQTPASFEPALDYVVVKVPRFAFEKFPGADTGAHHAHEVGRRGDGDRPQLPRGPAEGAALAGEQPGPVRAGASPPGRRRRSLLPRTAGPRTTAGWPPCTRRSAPAPASTTSPPRPASTPGSSSRSTTSTRSPSRCGRRRRWTPAR